MELSELRARYRCLMSMPTAQLSSAGNGQYSGTLLEQGWIRILLIRYSSDSSDSRVEVELRTNPLVEKSMRENDAIQMIQTIISYLQYLKNLVDNGFELDVVENSCVWTVYKEFHREIQDVTLRLLLPDMVTS